MYFIGLRSRQCCHCIKEPTTRLSKLTSVSSRDSYSIFTFLLSLRKQQNKIELDLNQKNWNNKNQQQLPKTEDRTVGFTV